MKILFFLITCFVSSNLLAQEIRREISSFKYLKVSRGIEVTLVKSDAKEVIINLHGLDAEDLIVLNKNDELIIKVSTNFIWHDMDHNHWRVRVEVPFQYLAGIESTTGAKIISKDLIKSDDLEIDVSVGAEAELRVDAKTLYVEASMGSEIKLEGTADFLNVRASMGSEANLKYLSAMKVKAKSAMGATILVLATDEFSGSVTMGGEILVSGNPEKFSKNESMGGDIRSRSN